MTTTTKRQRDEDRAELMTMLNDLTARLERLTRSFERTTHRRDALRRTLGLDDD